MGARQGEGVSGTDTVSRAGREMEATHMLQAGP